VIGEQLGGVLDWAATGTNRLVRSLSLIDREQV